MKLISLTGGIGSGKSTIASRLADHGAVIIDADQVARDVVEPGQPALEAIFDALGHDLRQPDGSLNRSALGSIVLSKRTGTLYFWAGKTLWGWSIFAPK